MSASSLFIGWDVGGWNCEKNSKSRDALVVLNDARTVLGTPWRGNLRESIERAGTTREWLDDLLKKCKVQPLGESIKITMGIDAPLGFSVDFVHLVTKGHRTSLPLAVSGSNPYLFRRTERELFEKGLRPLSSVKDMIGSQATKAIHALSKFAPTVESCGVWTDGASLRAIETYPSACRASGALTESIHRKPSVHADLDDAHVCALIALLFDTDRIMLDGPSEEAPLSEGWIWTLPLTSSSKATSRRLGAEVRRT